VIAPGWNPLPLQSFAAEIRLAHVGAVILSGALFFMRGMLVLAGRHARAMAAPLRYLSYSIDTILLLAALLLLTILPAAAYGNGWLWVKLLLLPVYVALGWMALHKAATRAVRFGLLAVAVLTYLMMASIARAHHPLGWLRSSLDRQNPALVVNTSSAATDCPGSAAAVPPPTGTALLSWEAPTTRTNGAPLVDLQGYRIQYGLAPDQLQCLVEIRDPDVTTWKVTGLSAGTWYFTVVSFDSGFVESDLSGVAFKRVD
jgi:uncharacterized membrane protein SirB2